MVAELTLEMSWIPDAPVEVDGLRIQRGRANVLAYDDGLTVSVRVYNPGRFLDARSVSAVAAEDDGPGSLALVAGAVPVDWRAELRRSGLSYLDRSGLLEVDWPRLRIHSNRLWRLRRRRTEPVPLQKGHAAVAQEVLLRSFRGESPTVGEIASDAGVSQPTASKAITQLAESGLVVKRRLHGRVEVDDVDQEALAKRLLARSPWPQRDVVYAYAWGRSPQDVASRLTSSSRGRGRDWSVAVSGRTGASAYGILGTDMPRVVQCWVAGPANAEEALDLLDAEVAGVGDANVAMALDRWGTGTHRSRERLLGDRLVIVSNPLRIWCDLHAEVRGDDFADQLWGAMADVV